MKIFGFSLVTILIVLAAFVIGTKYPNALKGLPVIGS